jgi:hypothetical protein
VNRRAALGYLALVFVLAGCGETSGSATLWVTRDRGHEVLLVARVPAGLTAMQALDRKDDIKTSYGGRFVDAIGGVKTASHHDWFYFLNGIDADRSAVEVRLRKGDNLWWDYRSWRQPHEVAAVIGAFPQPFVSGTTVVIGNGELARKLARVVHGTVGTFAPRGAYSIELRTGGTFRALDGHRFVLDPGLAARILANPALVRFRFEFPA